MKARSPPWPFRPTASISPPPGPTALPSSWDLTAPAQKSASPPVPEGGIAPPPSLKPVPPPPARGGGPSGGRPVSARRDGQHAGLQADGAVLAAAGKDGSVRLWDAATGKELQRFQGHEGNVSQVFFSSTGKTLVSIGFRSVRSLGACQRQGSRPPGRRPHALRADGRFCRRGTGRRLGRRRSQQRADTPSEHGHGQDRPSSGGAQRAAHGGGLFPRRQVPGERLQ